MSMHRAVQLSSSQTQSIPGGAPGKTRELRLPSKVLRCSLPDQDRRMEFPHGHHHPHSHHHRRDDDYDDVQNPPPPPPPAFHDYPPPHHPLPPPSSSYYEANENPPPPYPHAHQSTHFVDSPPYPQAIGGFSNSPAAHNPYPPPQTAYASSVSSSVHHVSHDLNPQSESVSTSHHHRLHMPSFPHHTQSHHDQLPPQPSDLADKPAVRVFSKAEPNYSLTIREGKVILAPSNPSDPLQRWIKDEKYSTKVKDEEGFPSFALVNKATGQALKHSIGATHPVQLVLYNPNALDESILWTLSKDLGDSYRTIRMVNNIRLNVDAFNGDKNHGGVHDGTTIVLWEWKKGENQRWKIIPY